MLLAGARVSFHFIIVLLTTLLVGFSGLAHASTPQQTAPAATQQKPEQPSAGQPDTDKPSTDKPSTGKPENKITPEQAEQLFASLKYMGREVLFVRFEGQSHGLSRGGHPKLRKERLKHILGWFEKYL